MEPDGQSESSGASDSGPLVCSHLLAVTEIGDSTFSKFSAYSAVKRAQSVPGAPLAHHWRAVRKP